MNLFVVTGRLTRDPEMKFSQSGTPICNFAIANNEGFGEHQKTLFLDCVAFGTAGREKSLASAIADNLLKGSRVLLQGELSQRDWEGQDGVKRRSTELKVFRADFLDPKEKREEGEQRQLAPAGDGFRDVDPDEIPF